MQLKRIEFGSYKNCMGVCVVHSIDKLESIPCVPEDYIEFSIQSGSQGVHFNLHEDDARRLLQMLQSCAAGVDQ